MTPGPSTPEQDRREAARIRHGPRRAAGLGDMVAGYLKSPAAKRARKFGKVIEALDAVIPETQRPKVVPVSWRAGSLTLEVDNAALLAELKQFRQQAIVQALVERGTAVTRLVFRLKRAKG